VGWSKGKAKGKFIAISALKKTKTFQVINLMVYLNY
jgi:hypothetical protein